MKVLLVTLHAKYVHNSLALPCLGAACRDADGVETTIREFTVNEPPGQVLHALVDEKADVAAFSCYIWNIEQTLKHVSDLKQLRPETFIILGGPEASYGAFELMTQHPAIDCIVRGEGEVTFRELVNVLRDFFPGSIPQSLLADVYGIVFREDGGISSAGERDPVGDLDCIPSPFSAGLADLSKPLVYYESSRGCPFSCAFCLSSLERGVRSFSMERIRSDLGLLIGEGVNTVKFVDRTFNYDAARADAIWDFIISSNRESRFHFEVAADLLTDGNFATLRKVPAGVFRFEIGVQSGEDETLERVGRKVNLERLSANVRRLREETGVLVHLDLVAGLPGEDFAGFLRSLQLLFDLLAGKMRSHAVESNIQVEVLKVLKGSPMRRIAHEENYAFSAAPPYRVLRTPWLSYDEICRIETIGRLVDLLFNSGSFRNSLARIAMEMPLSECFSAAARHWEDNGLPTALSRTALFDTFWCFAEKHLPEKTLEGLRDTLCYDFCLAEYPYQSGLPCFFKGESGSGRGNSRDDIVVLAGKFEVPKGSRVRTYRQVFGWDYSSTPWGEGPVELLFVYISTPGKGLRVEVVKV